MKKLKKLLYVLICVIMVGCMFNIHDVQAAKVKVNKTKASIYIGKTFKLKVTGTKAATTWWSDNESVATVSENTGKVTGKKKGTAVIYGYVNNKALSVVKCKVTVNSVISVSSKEIYLDGTDDATVKVTLKQACGLRYSIANSYVASCSWDDGWYENNKVTYLYVTGNNTGTTYITITNKFNNEKVKIKVIVDTTVKVEGVNISSSSESLYVGDSVNLSAEVYPSNATDTEIEWYSEDKNIATVSEYGRVEAVATGQTRIIAMSSDGGYTASCTVTVQSPVNVKLPQTPITIKNYGYRGTLRKACTITNVRFACRKSGNEYYYQIFIDGEKTFDTDGNYISSNCPVGYKLYRNGVVVKSGTIFTTEISVGERFADCYANGFIDAGNYELKLLDVQF